MNVPHLPPRTHFFQKSKKCFIQLKRSVFPQQHQRWYQIQILPYQNYQGNVNSVMSPATYAASNSNGTLNPTLHTGGTVLPSTPRPQRTNDLTLQTISSVNQVLGHIAPASIHVYTNTRTTANRSPANARRNTRPRKPSTDISDLP